MEPQPKVCYLCAEPVAAGELDDEHVFPENLFNPGDRADLIKLPAHRACNASYSKDDEYFRLCMTTAAGDEPKAKTLWNGPVLRGVHRPQSAKYKAYIHRSLREVEVSTEAGIHLGKAHVMDQDAARIQRVVQRMARGLHTHLTGDILPRDWPVSCDLLDPRTRTDPGWSLFCTGVRTIGNGTVCFAVKRLDEDPRDALYWIVFYDSIDFWAFTGTKIQGAIDAALAKIQERA